MRHLIIGPGSMIVYAFIGALKNLSDRKLLDDLQEISCSSTGSLLGMFYVLAKGDVEKVFTISLDAPVADVAKPDITCLLEKFGLINADKFEKLFSKYAIELTGMDPTFAQLYEYNPIKLHIPTYDLITGRTIYMSVDTTPDMKVSHAVRRSISVPVIMTPTQKRYLDGSLIERSPYVPFLGKTDVLEIRFRGTVSPTNVGTSKTFIQYLYSLIMALLNVRTEYTDFHRLDIYSDVQIFDFSMSLEKKLQMYLDGYSQAESISTMTTTQSEENDCNV